MEALGRTLLASVKTPVSDDATTDSKNKLHTHLRATGHNCSATVNQAEPGVEMSPEAEDDQSQVDVASVAKKCGLIAAGILGHAWATLSGQTRGGGNREQERQVCSYAGERNTKLILKA